MCLTHNARAFVPKRDAKATRKFPEGNFPRAGTTLTWPCLQVPILQVWANLALRPCRRASPQDVRDPRPRTSSIQRKRTKSYPLDTLFPGRGWGGGVQALPSPFTLRSGGTCLTQRDGGGRDVE